MKKLVIICTLVLFFISCSRTIYVPVENVRTEYIDRQKNDSIYMHDSIFIHMKGDTIWMEKYRYQYRDRMVTDSIMIKDTIRIPYPVIEVQETNRLNSFQSFQIWCGRILLIILIGYTGFRINKQFIN